MDDWKAGLRAELRAIDIATGDAASAQLPDLLRRPVIETRVAAPLRGLGSEAPARGVFKRDRRGEGWWWRSAHLRNWGLLVW